MIASHCGDQGVSMTDTHDNAADFGFSAQMNVYGSKDAINFAAAVNFQREYKGSYLSVEWVFGVDGSIMDVNQVFLDVLGEGAEMRGSSPRSFLIQSKKALVHIVERGSEDDPWVDAKRSIFLFAWGDPEVMRRVLLRAKEYPRLNNPHIVWNYISENKRMEATVFAQPARTTPDSFYPYLPQGVEAFIRGYMASNASILLLRGEPGTGKTSFIQKLLWTMNTNAMITYEERLFNSDEMFVSFLTSSQTNLLIMEDADTMLYSRERDGNRIMAKFLNVADGLIRFPDKKIIISSNLVEEHSIDPALLRPGRCYAAPIFRRLTQAEARVAADAANVELVGSRKDYSLAEILNGPAQERRSNVVGFR